MGKHECECKCGEHCSCHKQYSMHGAGYLGFYSVLAYIGAAIYFISQTNGGFWVVILALLKAIIWPVYAIYNVLRVLGAA